MPTGVYARTPEMKTGKYIRTKPVWNKGTKGIIKANKGSFQKGQIMEKSGHWKGGHTQMNTKYILIKKPDHSLCDCRGYVLKHRLIIEKQLKRYLRKGECVHHINKNPSDNRIKNLMVFKNATYHRWFHVNGFCNPKGIIFNGHFL